ncbi:hypothetical protein [Chryseobacterium sp.]|jgi:hypothetical protein|uniref:hypothetical protein n=1 Tax=Chryseobacterium sp. TaxID=1871047 RepID=UPI00285075E4|nr:hypothetical protein [Chryseobacterium sp.]MDR3026614.1 hypothetical protein [Chryseobacterium sp.]
MANGIKFQHFQYIKSGRKGVFDKIQNHEPYIFDFLKFEPPKDQRLIDAGVTDVLMSFDRQRKKILHTGLIRIDFNLYIGNNLNGKGKKDFIIVYYHHNTQILHFFYFPDRNPKNKSKFSTDVLKKHLFNNN